MKSPNLSANHDLITPTKHFHEIFYEIVFSQVLEQKKSSNCRSTKVMINATLTKILALFDDFLFQKLRKYLVKYIS